MFHDLAECVHGKQKDAVGDDVVKLEDSRHEESNKCNLTEPHNQLARGLKSRHVQFIALGGAIGTGLFVGSGGILASTGPAALFMAYVFMLLVAWNVLNNVAEMVTYLPMQGINIPYFVGRFVDPSLALAAGWNYWYAYAMCLGAEATAAGIIIEYWGVGANIAIWITIVLAVILLLNIVAVSIFGEAEFWFASIKLITICGLIILGIVIFFGGGPSQDSILGFQYWKDPGAFVEYKSTGSTGRFLGCWHALVTAGFAYILSPESIAIAAGETVAPRRNIPKAARRFVWRLALFYGVSSLLIGILVPSNDTLLLGVSNASASPFVIGIERAGIPVLSHIINAAILTAAWSAGNYSLYCGSRVLYSMALSGSAPKLFSRTSANGVPWIAVLFTWAFGLLAYLNVSNTGATVFGWFMNIATTSGFIAWIIVMITYLRFRRAMEHNNLLHTLPYKTALQPHATYVVLVIVSLVTMTNGFQTFIPFNIKDFVAAYITIPVLLLVYIGHKVLFRTSIYIPIDDIDVLTGKKEMDELEAKDRERVPKNCLQSAWYWLA